MSTTMTLDLEGRTLRSVLPAAPLARPLLAAALAGLTLTLLMSELTPWPATARIAVGVFAFAVIAWTVLRLADTPVALAACIALIALGGATPQAFYASLGDSLIWLLIGAFIIAAVLQHSGLAERWALQAVAGAHTAPRLLMRLTWVIAATAFIVPSTSGRAALLLPVFLVLARAVGDARIVRALALLFPSVILLSACASLLGAGAHLVAVDFMRRLGHDAPSFALWAWWAAPFAIVSSFAATALISALFLDHEARAKPLQLPTIERKPLTRQQRGVVAVTLLTVAAWAGGALHGVDATLVALLGALAITCKPLTGVDMKTALKKVEWNLVLFLAATLVLGEALLHSGAARALADTLLNAVPLTQWGAAGVLMLAVAIALLSHLLITSRTARALVLLPTVALPLAATGLNPALLIFVCVVGSGFCQTLAVSAKPVALFARAELPPELVDPRASIDSALLRLSLALLPLMALLLWAFALVVWPMQGLPLQG
jgi:solute carrier family 13 (sodium-dependent dicarboxylate transporter), member 2/3/5